MQASASARVIDAPRAGAARPLGSVLPPQVQAAAHLPVINPKIWETDLEGAKPSKQRPDTGSFLASVGRAAALRAKGDPMATTINQVANKLVYFLAKSTSDFVRVTFETLAKTSRVCKETARTVVRFLEARGILDTFNVVVRTADGDVWRAANLYFLCGDVQAAPAASAKAGAEGMIDRVTDRLRRYAATFGLKARKWGLNAFPLRAPALAPPAQDTG